MEVLGRAQVRTTTDTHSLVMPSAAIWQIGRAAQSGIELAPVWHEWPPRWPGSGGSPGSNVPGQRGGAEGTRIPARTLPGRHDRRQGGSLAFR